MKCKIVTGRSDFDLKKLLDYQPDDFIIGADSGTITLLNNDIPINLACGDFDSVSEEQLNEIKAQVNEIVYHPERKNFTDTFLALEEAMKRGCTDIEIYGGLGGRIDHTLANINLLKLGDIKLISENEVMYILDPGDYDINNTYKYVSFFALEDVKDLTLQGFDYELYNFDLDVDNPLCISNKGKGSLHFTEGLMLVIHQNEL